MKPTPYDISDPQDLTRWFNEMHHYLITEDFIHNGTDLEGRQYALEAFIRLKDQSLLQSLHKGDI